MSAKKITQLFTLSVKNKGALISNTLDKHHIRIEDPDKVLFSDINIVTGPNGAGKTRFLNALLELYQKASNTEVLYGYFPALSSARVQPKPLEPGEDPPWDYTLWEFLQNIDNATFSDFFKEIESQNESFIAQLLVHGSKNEKALKTGTLRQVSELFFDFTGKRIVEAPTFGLVVEDRGGTRTALSEELERLSPGERVLFYMSIFFSLKRSKSARGKWVIILDEPETHLHPEALLKFVRTLRTVFPGATIWIATHSLFLLPEFQFENIVYLENGVVLRRHADLYQKALSGLLGEGNENVSRFFASLPHWQYFEFIAECFTNPTVVSAVNPRDEQVLMFIETLKKREITRVLDCGGGSGRLGLSMMETTVAEWGGVTYDIYDTRPTYKGKAFKVYKQLENTPGNYDCVVMMNVLHEVPPQEWSDWFRKLYDQMSPDGCLLFVEVKSLQTGECPNDTGYLVLGREELEILFDTTDLTEIRLSDKQKSVGVLVASKHLLNIKAETVSAAIQHLEERAYRELQRMRAEENKRRTDEKTQKKPDAEGKKPSDFKARRYAFFSQQYINAKMFNDEERKRREEEQKAKDAVTVIRDGGGIQDIKKEAQSKKEELEDLLNKLDYILSTEHSTSVDARAAIANSSRRAVNEFLKTGVLSADSLRHTRIMADAAMAIMSNMQLDAVLLRICSLLGDETATEEFKAKRYARYL